MTENSRSLVGLNSLTMAKERPVDFSTILTDNHSNIQVAFKKLNNADQIALVTHFNEVSDEFGDYMFGIEGI